MNILKAVDVSRYYKIHKDKVFYALKEFSFTFPNKGLVSICGKSGSGKTTLLNLISLVDKPNSGKIYLFGEDIKKWNKKRINKFRNEEIGIIFQHYNLLEQESALFNIKLPLLIKGISEADADKKVYSLCEELSFDKQKLKEKVSNLSGGEKQRVGILRAVINSPKIIIADEPTGALDSLNSKKTMSLLKEISRNTLVIMVSHNLELVNEYSDVILKIKDGCLCDVVQKEETKGEVVLNNNKKPFLSKNSWVEKQGIKIFKRKTTKNIVSIISLSFGLILSILSIGFKNGSTEATIKTSYRQLDYGVMSVSHEETKEVKGSKISLIQEKCPSQNEIRYLKEEYPELIFTPNLSYFFPRDISLSINEEAIENISYTPIYQFSDEFIDKTLLFLGKTPKNKQEVLINKNAYNLFKKKNLEPLNLIIDIKSVKELVFLTGKEERESITDYFIYEDSVSIVGVVDDFSFLSTPKIYYSYFHSLDVIENSIFQNLSTYLGEEITYYDYLFMCSDDSPIKSYSYYAFKENYLNPEDNLKYTSKRNDNLVFSSMGLERKDACLSLIDISTTGMSVFSFISIIGTMLIVGILSFSSYMEDKKDIAIMFSLGSKSDDIISIYLINNLLISLISMIVAFLSTPILEKLINNILSRICGISNMINIPFMSYLNRPFFLPIIIVLILIIIIFLVTYFTISGSNHISLKEVLKSE